MELSLYQIDAFTHRRFAGNPAAVVPLEQWLDDELMQAIAMENNLAETAFFIPEEDVFALRWFTPTTEMDLCGHATLASAHVLFQHLGYTEDEIRFSTRSGLLRVSQYSKELAMELPSLPVVEQDCPSAITAALGVSPLWAGAGKNWLLVLESVADVEAVAPDFKQLLQVSDKNIIITAQGDDCDFVSRFFAPHVGVDEDPVTGSAHCSLTPFWAKRLGRDALNARQLSSRGGELSCRLLGDRVELAGQCVTYLGGRIFV